MYPAGEGVNVAVWDSMQLANAITKAGDTAKKDAIYFQSILDPLMKEFEVKMLTNSEGKAE